MCILENELRITHVGHPGLSTCPNCMWQKLTEELERWNQSVAETSSHRVYQALIRLRIMKIKPVNPKYSLEGLMMKLKLQYFGHLRQKADSLEKTLMLGKWKSFSPVWLFVTPWTAALQASLSITNSRRLLKLMSIESVMPSNHLILCHPLLPPSVFPASGSLPTSWLLASGGRSPGASASVLPVNI